MAKFHEHKASACTRFLRDVEYGRGAFKLGADCNRRVKIDRGAGEHPAGKVNRREKSAAARMAVGIDLGLARMGQEIKPMAERRYESFRPRWRRVIEKGCKSRERRCPSDIFNDLGAADPSAQTIYVHLGLSVIRRTSADPEHGSRHAKG